MLRIENLTKKYDSNVVLDDFNLNINHNEFVGFIGPNGVGKSTVIGCLCGIRKYEHGTIYIDGNLLKSNNSLAKRKVGVCFQDTIYDRFFSIYDSIRLYCMYQGYNRRTAKELSLNSLKKIGLIDYKDYMGDKLSGGMKKRFQIALSTAHNPDLLILDEPTAGVDLHIKEDLTIFLKNYITVSNKKTIILVSHDLDEISKLCTRAIFMKNGKIVNDVNINGQGSSESLYNIYNDNYRKTLWIILHYI